MICRYLLGGMGSWGKKHLACCPHPLVIVPTMAGNSPAMAKTIKVEGIGAVAEVREPVEEDWEEETVEKKHEMWRELNTLLGQIGQQGISR
jgi:hypothetical protein